MCLYDKGKCFTTIQAYTLKFAHYNIFLNLIALFKNQRNILLCFESSSLCYKKKTKEYDTSTASR